MEGHTHLTDAISQSLGTYNDIYTGFRSLVETIGSCHIGFNTITIPSLARARLRFRAGFVRFQKPTLMILHV